MVEVIKRNKRRQKFSANKLRRSIIAATREAKLGQTQGSQIAGNITEGIYRTIQRRKSVASTELRRKVLRRLESRSRAAIVAWRRHEKNTEKGFNLKTTKKTKRKNFEE